MQDVAVEDNDSGIDRIQDVELSEKHLVTFERPHSPTLIATSPYQMTLQWKALTLRKAPADAQIEGLAITYALLMQLETGKPSTSTNWSCAYMGTQLIEQVKGLRPGRSYSFRVECTFTIPSGANFEVESLASSETVIFSTPATVPSEPRQLSLANKAPNSLTVKWQAPSECGGPEVQCYTVGLSPHMPSCSASTPIATFDQEYYEVYRGSEARCKVGSLQPGEQYSFIVKASNAVGDSQWSRPASFATKARVPSCPSAPRCVPVAEDTMEILWEVPNSNGSPIDFYQCFMDDGQGGDLQLIYTGQHPYCRKAGLKGGTQYQARIFASNEAGRSLAGVVAHLSLPALLPSEPASLTVSKITRTGFHLGWFPPKDDGGSAVNQYTVDLKPLTSIAVSEGIPNKWCQIHWSKGPDPPSSCSFDGLTAGCKYMLRVRAQNEAGPGPYSRTASFQTASTVPYPPGAPRQVDCTADTMVLEWDAPLHDGGSEIQAYELDLREAEQSEPSELCEGQFQHAMKVNGKLNRASACGLRPATSYQARVRAENSQGFSGYSSIGMWKTKAGSPGRPANLYLTCKPIASQLRLAWDMPESNGAEITSHHAQIWPASSLTSYAKQLTGASQPSSENGVLSDDGDEPANGKGHPGHENAAVSTTSEEAHSESGQKTRGGKLHRLLQSYTCKSPACDAEGLEPDTEYLVKVRSSNSAGPGEWSQPVLFRTGPAAPSIPHSVYATGKSSSTAAVEWQPPLKANGSPVLGYRLEICSSKGRGNSPWEEAAACDTQACQVDGLQGGRLYLFRVSAWNELGWGPWSAAVSTRTLPGPPDPPSPPTFSGRASTSVRVSWQPPPADNGAPVRSYRVEAKTADGGFQIIYFGPELQCRAKDLRPATEHIFRVQAVNHAGASGWSREGSIITKEMPPSPPQRLSLSPVSETVIRLRWEDIPRDGARAQPVSYEVEAIPISSEAQTLRQATKGESKEIFVSKLMPGMRYQVRLRSAGDAGSGHSDWSEPQMIMVPDSKDGQSLRNVSSSKPSASLPGDNEVRPSDSTSQSSATEALKRRHLKQVEPRQGPKARARPPKQSALAPLIRMKRKYGNWLFGVLLSVFLIVITYQIIKLS